MAEDRIKILEQRLTRLEAAQAQQPTATPGFTAPGGTVVDPAPWPGGGGWPWHPRWPPPIVDMAPWWGGGWGHPRWPPSPVVDPAPWPSPIVDPAVFGGGVLQQRANAAAALGRIGPNVDPPPPDLSRFTISQLESTLHTINAEKARLGSMETLVNQHLERLKKQEQG